MKETTRPRHTVIFTSIALSATAGALVTLSKYICHEIERRGYPSWDACHCDFKTKQTIFQVWYSRHKRRGETIVAQEWGSYLCNPPLWMRRFLHHGSQVMATLNPRGRYVQRVSLNPQEAHRFVALLRGASTQDETAEELPVENGHVVWRREILHVPHYPLDAFVRRLYPAHVAKERARALPALWDPHSDLPLPTESVLLDTPLGTRIDYIGWTSSQVSYCTARIRE